jgi:hypothetical protein
MIKIDLQYNEIISNDAIIVKASTQYYKQNGIIIDDGWPDNVMIINNKVKVAMSTIIKNIEGK